MTSIRRPPRTAATSLASVDLNLLVALDALLAEASVSAAARRLGIGQPAASHALARLRELLGDPLLVRVGRRMVPTPRATALRAPLTRLLDDARRLLVHAAEFDPATSTRRFSLTCPDLLAPLIPRLLARLRARAPGLRLEVDGRVGEAASALERGAVDIALVPLPREAPGLIARRLGTVELVVVAAAEHPALTRGRLTLRKWLASPHVLVRTGSNAPSLVDQALAAAGHTREIGLVVPSFFPALIAAADSDLFYVAPRELVVELAPRFGLRLHRLPLPVPPISVAALWHERDHRDAGHEFFRAEVVATVDAMLESGRRGPCSRVPDGQ